MQHRRIRAGSDDRREPRPLAAAAPVRVLDEAGDFVLRRAVANGTGVSTIGREAPNSLYRTAFDSINTHGKDLHDAPLGKYFIHGLSHYAGMDVHDTGDNATPLRPGAVFTIEPGIYIPEEKIGVRIEDTFLVRADGTLDCLSCAAIKDPAEIEKAMRR